MAGRTDGLIKNFRAGAAIAPFRLVKFGGSDVEVVPCAAAADAVIGLSGELAAAQGERTDIHLSDIGDVTFGGPVVRGAPITSDANACAIAAAPAAGANVRIIGFALCSAAAGDIGPVRIAPGLMQG